jgi:hypothetical protein
MKQMITVLRAFLLVAVFASFAACSGGTFYDPGHEESGLTGGGTPNNPGNNNGNNNGSISKPGHLSDSASYNDFLTKKEDIIKYCNAHPGTANDNVKNAVNYMSADSSTWTYTKTVVITQLNVYIDQLV